MPEVSPAPSSLVIVRGRHPLLLSGKEPVVPFDLELAAEERTLLISGPNTGGKTVLLKAVGLAAALAQSGIVPPLAAGSRLPVFGRFYADIGDRQSIAASLSTFSAHVGMLRRILDQADDATLVLLDEVGSGTDPAEGAALAAAALVSLTERGSVTLATTHLGALKNLASQTPGVVNASLQFDAATLTPTYRFLKGVPGRSYGLAIARRLGVASDVLSDAESRVPDAERSLDVLLASVEERQRELRAAQEDAAARTIELDALGARLAAQAEAQTAREAELKRKEKEADRTGRQLAKNHLMEARQLVEQALGAARAAADDAGGARGSADGGGGNQGSRGRSWRGRRGRRETQETRREIAVGDRVRLASGGAGEVLEVRADGKIVVAIGAMKMVADTDQATELSGGRPTPARALCVVCALCALSVLSRNRPPRHDRRRGGDGDDRRRGRRGVGGAAFSPHHSRHGNRRGTRASAPSRGEGPPDRELRLRAPEPGRHRCDGRGVLRMSMIPEEIVEQVRDSADLVSIIGEAVELKRTGSDYRGPCPFHGGTHRNFAVIPKKGRYYCFVCHESGDVFTWLMKRLGMDYPTAVREVARKVGIIIPKSLVVLVLIRSSRSSAPSQRHKTGSRGSWSSRRTRKGLANICRVVISPWKPPHSTASATRHWVVPSSVP